MNESDFIASLKAFATHPGARNLDDDAAVLEVGGSMLVLTHDMIVEGVHYLPSDPPADVAWKLVAVNLSDLAAKGARPLGVLLGYSLGDDVWDRAFAEGLGTVLGAFGIPLLGGDTVGAPHRTLGLTALGEATPPVPSRAGARPGDQLWVTGSIGDAGAGLRVLKGALNGPETLVERYRSPRPRLEAGRELAPIVSAMMDISDGLLIDASRLAEAGGVALEVDLGLIPLSTAFLASLGDGRDQRLAAATSGDDYELLFAAPADLAAELLALSEALALSLTRIGVAAEGTGLRLTHQGEAVALPSRLGWEHR